MIRMSVLYPSNEGSTFDLDYYREQHMAIVRRDMPAVKRIEVDQAIDGPYMAVGHLYFDSAEDLQASMGNGAAAMADIPNFTNVQPFVQVATILDD